MKYKTKSWKEIIDPSFDTLLKAVDKSFDLVEMQSNEEIENFLMNLKSSSIRSFKKFYDSRFFISFFECFYGLFLRIL